jgi:solute carrier family 6 (neurotransmitter transporter, amino acid/orphan) member 15/16/17/18/20
MTIVIKSTTISNTLSTFCVIFQYPLPWASCPEINNTIVAECARSSETAYFWYRTTLDAAPSMDDSGGFKWWIVICLMLSWTIVFFIVMKGIQSSGKVSISFAVPSSPVSA